MSLLRRRMMMSVKEPDVPTDELDYLTIIPLHEEEETYKINVCQGSEGGSWFPEYSQLAPLYYRVNNGEWLEFMFEGSTTGDTIYVSINLKKGDELQLKCTTYDLKRSDYNEFYTVVLHMKHKFNVRGTPMSLVYGDDFKENNVAPNYLLDELFYGSGITKILNPKTFLPCTVLERYCYSHMFQYCTNLVNTPELPVTTLEESCYNCMFYGCTSLITAPDLPATTLAAACYDYMFYGCTNLNFIKMLATDISANYCLRNWVNGVSSTGTFVKHPDMTSLPTGVNGIPEGWTVVNDGEEEGGKIINTGRIKPILMKAVYINWDFPVASNVLVFFHTEMSTYEIDTNTGLNKSSGLTLGPGESELMVDYIEPTEDDTYIYEVIVEE